jgi:Zn-dependent protease with chaperone function
MDFFKQQDIARRKSYFLVLLFVISILILIILSNIVVFSFYAYFNSDSLFNFYIYWHLKTFLSITIPLVSTLVMLTYFKLKEFRDTTTILDNYFNAVLINKYKATSEEKKLLNIVSEMSIASGIPPINTYVIDDFGINSFVLGNNHEDASIVVSSTALEKLSRDELQAMVAHEFAKIFTNDMSLNIKLTAITYSLLSISLIGQKIYSGIGYSFNESRRESDDSHGGPFYLLMWIIMAVIGIFFFMFGSIGYILSSIIKLLIIRQRMYLNDAITIEYIRNPSALINLLKISFLHQSYIDPHNLFEHAYFIQNNDNFFTEYLDIYPKVSDRINRLNENGIYDLPIKKVEEKKVESKKTNKKDKIKKKLFDKENVVQTVTGIMMLDNFSVVQSYGKTISTQKESLPEFINVLLDDIDSTKALIISILLSNDEEHKKEQINLIPDNGLKELVLSNYERIRSLEGKHNLLIYFHSLNILKQLDINSYRIYRTILNKIIYLDGILDIFEWNIENILVRQLDIHFSLRTIKKEKYSSYESLQYSLEVFLSLISYSQDSKNIKASTCFEIAAKTQNMNSLNFIDKKDISNNILKQAIKDLEDCSLELRKDILELCVVCICVDNIVENWEIELIYSISILLRIPLPLFKI